MSNFLITGGTGLVGKALTKMLTGKGHEVIILTRDPAKAPPLPMVQYAHWDVKKQTIDRQAVEQADYIFHLAGASVFAKRWTKKYKKEIEQSRVMSSRLLVETLATVPHNVKAIVSSSAIGWYGADRVAGKAFTEEDPAAADFLGMVCGKWEAAIGAAEEKGVPVIKLRTGMVFSNEGGFLEPVQKGLKWGIAAIPGNGRQIISWIHIDDLCRLFLFAAENEAVRGSINAVASMPLPMKDLTLKEATLLKRNRFITVYVPGFLLRLALGAMSTETTKSITVSNSLIRSKGFQFIYPAADAALEALAKDPTQ
ncbi:MAG: TIGR01777 family oxidoreductase [Ferruginibacter sp.]